MALSCLLGFAACLAYQGDNIPMDDVNAIQDTCSSLSNLAPYTYVLTPDMDYRAYGYSAMDYLEDLGLNFSWKPDEWNSRTMNVSVLANYRKAEILRACREFNIIARNPNNWEN